MRYFLALLLLLVRPPIAAAAIVDHPWNFEWVDTSANETAEDGFIIELKKADGSYVEIGRVGPNVTKATIKMMSQEGANYCFACKAFNLIGISERAEACARMKFLPRAPNKPLEFKATPA